MQLTKIKGKKMYSIDTMSFPRLQPRLVFVVVQGEMEKERRMRKLATKSAPTQIHGLKRKGFPDKWRMLHKV